MTVDMVKLTKAVLKSGKQWSDLLTAISAPTLSRVKHGKPVQIRTVLALASLLQCDPEDILKEE